jgi:hypothetical protein
MLRVPLAGTLFFASGFAALIYQVAWQRLLVRHTGVGVISVSIVVAAFMAGLGIGSYVGGRWSARVSAERSLRLFAFAEVALGVFGCRSDSFYYDWLHRLGLTSLWYSSTVSFLALLPPTVLMGLSLPFLARAMVRSPGPGATRVVGFLYAVNLLGAATGALVSPWFLIRFVGVRGAVSAGAAANFVAGLGALAMGSARASEPSPPPSAAVALADSDRLEFRLWLVLYAMSGFCAIALEILWFRLIDVAVKATAFTFGTVLCVYLAGVATGSLGAVAFARVLRRPLRVFLLSQCLLMAYAAAAVALLVRMPVSGGLGGWFYTYWGQYDGFVPGEHQDVLTLLRLYALLPLGLYGVPTVLMGVSFVALQRAVQDDVPTSGLKVGLLQSANIAGCVGGSLATGLLCLGLLGTSDSLRVVVLCGLVFAYVGVRRFGIRSSLGLAGSLLLCFAWSVPDGQALWLRLHGLAGGPAAVEEDATGIAFFAPDPRGNFWRLSLDGRGASSLPFGWIHSLLGAVPAIVHPEPADVAIVGLGSGDTAWAASCRRETRRTRVFELLSPEPRVLKAMAEREPWPDLRAFLADRRIAVTIEDGRLALERGDARYDLIEGDPLEPDRCLSGYLYSLEYFQLCGARLRRGGLVSAWLPTPRARATFVRAFRYVIEFDDGAFFVGSNDRIGIDVDAWLRRLGPVAEYLGPYITSDAERCLRTARLIDEGGVTTQTLNRDLEPRDEFLSP